MENLKEQHILIHGRLGQNPELRYTKKQEPVCIFSIAENIPGATDPIWHRIVVWGKQAEHCSVMLKKGSPVFVRGQKVTRSFLNKEGEQKGIEEVQAQLVGISIAS
jgi:single-strand DNA-binding protein